MYLLLLFIHINLASLMNIFAIANENTLKVIYEQWQMTESDEGIIITNVLTAGLSQSQKAKKSV